MSAALLRAALQPRVRALECNGAGALSTQRIGWYCIRCFFLYELLRVD